LQTEALEVVVDRTRWARGVPGSLLLSSITGKCCILGFACLSAGATEEQIEGIGTVDELVRHRKFKYAALGAMGFAMNNASWEQKTTDEAAMIMRFNDQRLGTNFAECNGLFTEADRELIISDLLAKQKIAVTYIN
jgi:hypothetical protein